MKNIHRLFKLAVLPVALAALSTAGYAATAPADLTVSAQIADTCSITTTPVAFGVYDPIVANRSAPLNGTGTVTTACTNGLAVNVTLGEGLYANGGTTAIPVRQMASGINRLGYFLYVDSARGTVWGDTVATGNPDVGDGNPRSLTVYGAVTQGQNKAGGNYVDTVVATVTF